MIWISLWVSAWNIYLRSPGQSIESQRIAKIKIIKGIVKKEIAFKAQIVNFSTKKLKYNFYMFSRNFKLSYDCRGILALNHPIVGTEIFSLLFFAWRHRPIVYMTFDSKFIWKLKNRWVRQRNTEWLFF